MLYITPEMLTSWERGFGLELHKRFKSFKTHNSAKKLFFLDQIQENESLCYCTERILFGNFLKNFLNFLI